MENIQYIVLRSTGGEGNQNVVEKQKIESLRKGQSIRELIGNVGQNTIKILTSKNTRDYCVGDHFGVGLCNDITFQTSTSEFLNTDYIKRYGINGIIELIKQFQDSNLLIVIIAHLDNLYEIAKGLGYKGEKLTNLGFLDGYYFDNEGNPIHGNN